MGSDLPKLHSSHTAEPGHRTLMGGASGAKYRVSWSEKRVRGTAGGGVARIKWERGEAGMGLGRPSPEDRALGATVRVWTSSQSSSHMGRMGFDFWHSKLPSCQERGPRGHKTLLLRATGSGERLEWRRTGGSIRGAKEGGLEKRPGDGLDVGTQRSVEQVCAGAPFGPKSGVSKCQSGRARQCGMQTMAPKTLLGAESSRL